MVRKYTWQLKIRSYEGDAWGLVPASGFMRYLEESAVVAARDVGYGRAFHDAHGSAWVIRRMSLVLHVPAHIHGTLEITTWISNFDRVRGGREYRVTDADSGELVASGLAEWVYVVRKTLKPLAIPRELTIDFDVPGAPLYEYNAPSVTSLGNEKRLFTTSRVAEWHECDSMGHINNTVYVDWLDDAWREALLEMGLEVGALRARGLQLRGEHYKLDYRRAAMPGERLTITTRLEGAEERLYQITQSIALDDGTEIMVGSTVYGWYGGDGLPVEKPEQE